jgi:hypothetical protein
MYVIFSLSPFCYTQKLNPRHSIGECMYKGVHIITGGYITNVYIQASNHGSFFLCPCSFAFYILIVFRKAGLIFHF